MNMCPGAWVIINGGFDDIATAWGVPPHAHEYGTSPGPPPPRPPRPGPSAPRTRLPARADELVLDALEENAWGRFDVNIDGASLLLALVGFFMNARSRLTGIATGDQAIFVRRDAFTGFPDIALMEDIAFSAAMKRRSPPACLHEKVTTSGRRWEERGVMRTILLMWRLRLAYFLGTDPDDLARRYASKA